MKRPVHKKVIQPVTEYMILRGIRTEALAGLVNGMIAQGWHPVGGVAFSPETGTARGSGYPCGFYQAMEKS
jgi:hypothetical protein